MAASADGTQAQVDRLAADIRQLKAELKAQGLSNSKINQHEAVLQKVQELQSWKQQLSSDDPRRDEAFFARQKQENEELEHRKQAQAAQQRAELKAAEESAPSPLVQRKIFHLFQHTGSGPTFRYEPPPRLNTKDCGFGKGPEPFPAVYVTEKWDGTTMQATSTHIFKRLDLWGKRKDGADATQRYGLRLLAWREQGPAENWKGLDFADSDPRILEALRPYLARLATLEPGLCVYFEAVHTDINANFKHLPGFADMRVFDFSRAGEAGEEGRFLPFDETIALSKQYGLPLVAWEKKPKLSAEEIWSELLAVASGPRNYSTAPAPLEGFVVREAGAGGRIAKARAEQLQSEVTAAASSDPPTEAPTARTPQIRMATTYAEGLTRSTLRDLGIPFLEEAILLK